MTNGEKCDKIRYSVSEVKDGWQLIVDGADDPDPDRRADLLRAYRRLPREERLALVFRAMGMTDAEIASGILLSNHRSTGKRLADRSFAHLRGEMNG